jgi:hypothetical protein
METKFGLPKKKEALLDLLQQSYAEGNLTDQDYEDRISKVHGAKSIETLKGIVSDFPSIEVAKLFPVKNNYRPNEKRVATSGYVEYQTKTILGNKSIVVPELSNQTHGYQNILGTTKLELAKSAVSSEVIELKAQDILGTTTIDLRNKDLAGKEVNIHISCTLGTVKILLPKGVAIRNNLNNFGSTFLDRKSNKSWWPFLQKTEEAPEIPFTLNLNGNVFLATVNMVIYS